MTRNMKEFVEQAGNNKVLKTELEDLTREFGGNKEQALKEKGVIVEKTIEIAAKYGFTLTAEDFKEETVELTPDQLDAVSGGDGDPKKICACVIYGEGNYFQDTEGTCACPMAGYGGSDDGSGNTAMMRCLCAFMGFGWD